MFGSLFFFVLFTSQWFIPLLGGSKKDKKKNTVHGKLKATKLRPIANSHRLITGLNQCIVRKLRPNVYSRQGMAALNESVLGKDQSYTYSRQSSSH